MALKKTEPNIIRKIANISTNNLNSQPIVKKQKIIDENQDNLSKNSMIAATTATKVDNIDVSSLNKTKIIKIDAKQLVNLTANKKLIISKPKQMNASTISEGVLQIENVS